MNNGLSGDDMLLDSQKEIFYFSIGHLMDNKYVGNIIWTENIGIATSKQNQNWTIP